MLVDLGFSETIDRVYRPLLADQARTCAAVADRVCLPLAEVQAACDELVTAGLLLRSSAIPDEFVVIDPSIGIERLLAARSAELAATQQVLAGCRVDLQAMVEQYLTVHRESAPPAAVELDGPDEVARVVAEQHSRTTREVLSMQVRSSYPAAELDTVRSAELDLVSRGVSVRTLYPTGSRANPALRQHQRVLTEHGAQLRYAEELPMRMTILDREVGLIPLHAIDDGRSATLLRGAGVCAVLVWCFEQLWADAEPFDSAPERAADGVATATVDPSDLDRTLLQLMSQGIKDDAAARHLGVSVRTVRRQIADLMLRLDANSRFEAGMQAVLRGWLRPPT